MKQQFQARVAARKPSLWERIRDSLVGVAIIGGAGLLKWQGMFSSDLWFALMVMFGGMFLSKSLVLDFIGAVKDKMTGG